MRQNEEARYYKIGLFVLIGLALLIALILIFSSTKLFSGSVYAETYFNESVQGLTVGSPVKYRGIIIGKIKQISFVANMYDLIGDGNSYGRYIYVLFTINSDFLKDINAQELGPFIQNEIKAGLRAKLAFQDLTGNAYLEVNFTNPEQNPVLPISWKPNYIYIPSTTSTFTRVTDSVQSILEDLQKVNFPKFFDSVETLSETTNKTMQSVNTILLQSQNSLITTTHNMEAVSNNLQQLSGQLKANPSSILFDKPPVVDPSKL